MFGAEASAVAEADCKDDVDFPYLRSLACQLDLAEFSLPDSQNQSDTFPHWHWMHKPKASADLFSENKGTQKQEGRYLIEGGIYSMTPSSSYNLMGRGTLAHSLLQIQLPPCGLQSFSMQPSSLS